MIDTGKLMYFVRTNGEVRAGTVTETLGRNILDMACEHATIGDSLDLVQRDGTVIIAFDEHGKQVV